MQVGLWFTIGSVHAQSTIAKQHPEWIIKDKNGNLANLHSIDYEEDGDDWTSAIRTMSLGSPYYDHIKDCIRTYVKTLGISYLKLDLSIANSAYVHDLTATGDYDQNNPVKLYKDHASSLWVIYERMMSLMDDIHTEFPDMLLDCSFEVWGRYNLIDYALVEHGDYDWIANFDFRQPAGPISVRQMFYDRSRVVPASALLIGNQSIDSDNYPYVYFSMVSTSALMLGDPRKLTTTDIEFYLKWNKWFKEIEEKYQFSQYRQVYDIFDRPTDNNWDGNYRINTEKSSGLMFFFRNNSSDTTRIFKVPCLNPDNTYRIYSYEDGKTWNSCRGSDLINSGVSVTIPCTYSAKVLLIEKE
jgi:alpha-galactosidase